MYAAGELEREATSKDFLLVQTEGGRQITRSVNCYSLDAIISVGYRVNSTRATQFRIWATRILKEYIVRGYAINRERMRQLGQTVEVMKRVANSLDVEQVLDVVNAYCQAKGKGTLGRAVVRRVPPVCRQHEVRCGFAAVRQRKGWLVQVGAWGGVPVIWRQGPLSVFAGEGGEDCGERGEGVFNAEAQGRRGDGSSLLLLLGEG